MNVTILVTQCFRHQNQKCRKITYSQLKRIALSDNTWETCLRLMTDLILIFFSA